MKIDTKALGLTASICWGATLFFVGIANLVCSGYGQAFLDVMASIYPGYTAAASFGQVMVGTLYGMVDAAVAGVVLAWLYNRLARN